MRRKRKRRECVHTHSLRLRYHSLGSILKIKNLEQHTEVSFPNLHIWS